MSKKHKQKHRHHQKEKEHESIELHVEHQGHTTQPSSRMGVKTKALLVLIFGILLGVAFASFVTHVPTSKKFIADMLHEDETESEAAEHGVVEEGVQIAVEPAASSSVSVLYATDSLPLYAASTTHASATSSPLSVKIPVIIYHSVRPYTKGESKYQDLYDVTPELLDQELTYMEEHGYHAILMRDVDAYWRGATSSLPEKPVILTFDDGWKNQFEYAFPVLQKHHMKGVFYIFTNPIDHKNVHWMSWENVLTLDRAGMEIGGHSRTHPILTKLSNDNKKLDHEILEPKKIIEDRIGHSILSFAYPFGAKDIATEIAVARAGYQIARTTYSGVWNDPEHRLEFHGTLSSDKLSQFESLLNR